MDDIQKLSFFSGLADKLKEVIGKIGNQVPTKAAANTTSPSGLQEDDAAASEIMQLNAVPV